MKQMHELSQLLNMYMSICFRHKTGNPLAVQPRVLSLYLQVGDFGLRYKVYICRPWQFLLISVESQLQRMG